MIFAPAGFDPTRRIVSLANGAKPNSAACINPLHYDSNSRIWSLSVREGGAFRAWSERPRSENFRPFRDLITADAGRTGDTSMMKD